MNESNRLLLSGDEAIALAARHAGVALGAGYPGTPSTEILEHFHALGGHAQWSPNEKVALEVALGAAFGGARALCTMKHVGLNVAADPLFTAAYTGVAGGLVLVSADDPGMASSQNEQDNRHYARAAGVPMLEPSDSQEGDFLFAAVEISSAGSSGAARSPPAPATASVVRFKTEAPRRRTTKGCSGPGDDPAYARPPTALAPEAGRAAGVERSQPLNRSGDGAPGAGTSRRASVHARPRRPRRRACPSWLHAPAALGAHRAVARGVSAALGPRRATLSREAIRAAGIPVEGKADRFRFGERRRACAAFSSGTKAPNRPSCPAAAACDGCQYRIVFEALRRKDCIVAGDIG